MTFRRDLKDEFIKYLNSKGYMPILVPRVGLLPPTIYRLEGERYIRQADLVAWLEGRPDLKALLKTTPRDATDLTKQMAAKKGGKTSFSLLDKIISFFGSAVAPKLEAAADAGDDVKFSFKDCQVREVVPDTVITVLNAVPSKKFGAALNAKKVHIACEYLYARQVEISVGKTFTGSINLGVDAPGVGRFDAEAHANSTGGESASYGSDGSKDPVAIAFRVARVTFENKKYELEWDGPPGTGLLPRQGAPKKPYLSLTGQIYEVADDFGAL